MQARSFEWTLKGKDFHDGVFFWRENGSIGSKHCMAFVEKIPRKCIFIPAQLNDSEMNPPRRRVVCFINLFALWCYLLRSCHVVLCAPLRGRLFYFCQPFPFVVLPSVLVSCYRVCAAERAACLLLLTFSLCGVAFCSRVILSCTCRRKSLNAVQDTAASCLRVEVDDSTSIVISLCVGCSTRLEEQVSPFFVSALR